MSLNYALVIIIFLLGVSECGTVEFSNCSSIKDCLHCNTDEDLGCMWCGSSQTCMKNPNSTTCSKIFEFSNSCPPHPYAEIFQKCRNAKDCKSCVKMPECSFVRNSQLTCKGRDPIEYDAGTCFPSIVSVWGFIPALFRKFDPPVSLTRVLEREGVHCEFSHAHGSQDISWGNCVESLNASTIPWFILVGVLLCVMLCLGCIIGLCLIAQSIMKQKKKKKKEAEAEPAVAAAAAAAEPPAVENSPQRRRRKLDVRSPLIGNENPGRSAHLGSSSLELSSLDMELLSGGGSASTYDTDMESGGSGCEVRDRFESADIVKDVIWKSEYLKTLGTVKEMGSGSFAVVYSSSFEVKMSGYTGVRIPCALKALLDISIEKLQGEIKSMLKLKHPNLLQLYGVSFEPIPGIKPPPHGHTGIHPVIITELCEIDLGQLMKKQRKLKRGFKSRRVLKYALGIASGMKFLHSQNLAHRDLKSSNVLITKPDQEDIPKICDFGLTKEINRAKLPNSTICGSPLYMSPENLGGEKHRNAFKDDVFAFGMLMWELVTLRSPMFKELISAGVIPGTPQVVICEALLKLYNEGQRPKFSSSEFDRYQPGYVELIKRCWAQEPHERPSFKSIVRKIKKLQEEMKSARRESKKKLVLVGERRRSVEKLKKKERLRKKKKKLEAQRKREEEEERVRREEEEKKKKKLEEKIQEERPNVGEGENFDATFYL